MTPIGGTIPFRRSLVPVSTTTASWCCSIKTSSSGPVKTAAVRSETAASAMSRAGGLPGAVEQHADAVPADVLREAESALRAPSKAPYDGLVDAPFGAGEDAKTEPAGCGYGGDSRDVQVGPAASTPAAHSSMASRDSYGPGAADSDGRDEIDAAYEGDALHRGTLPQARHSFYGPPEFPMNFARVLRQMLYHTAWPASLPFVLLFEGWERGRVALRRQLLLWPNSTSSAINYFLCAAVPLLALLQIVAGHPMLSADVIMVVMVFFLRCGVISVKYGTISDDVWEQFTDPATPDAEADRLMQRMQLLSGWLNMSHDVAQDELDRAAANEQINMKKSFFYVEHMDRLDEWNAATGASKCPFAAERKYDVDEKRRRVSAGFIASMIMYSAETDCSTPRSWMLSCTALMAAFASLLPTIVRVSQAGVLLPEDGNVAIDAVVAILSVVTTFQFAFVLGMFLVTGIVDARRRSEMLKHVGSIVSSYRCFVHSNSRNVTDHIKTTGPMVDLRRPTNVVSWLYLRRTLIAHGRGFLVRIQRYTSLGVLLCAVQTIWLFAAALSWDPQSEEPFAPFRFLSRTADVSLTLGCVTMSVYVAVSITMTVGFYVVANRSFLQHKSLVVRSQMNVRQLLRCQKHSDEVRNDLQAADRLLDSVLRTLKMQDKLEPARILGLRADPLLLKSAGTVVLSAFLALANRMVATSTMSDSR